MDNKTRAYDAIIIGGGPAGSTAAAVLGMKGRKALVLEKDKFPRYHVGESLIPHCYFSLERIGMIPKLRASHFTKKYSVQFVTPSGKLSQPFYFSQHRDHPSSQTWQVLRSEFDQMMLDNAREKGATVMEETTVRELIEEDGTVVGVRALDKSGKLQEFRAPVTIDASGRDGMVQVRRGWRVRDPQLNKIAIWTYFRGAKRDPGLDEGATTVAYLPEKGWFWYIPLANDEVSVGIVAESDYLYRDTRDLPEIFCREIGKNLWIKDHLSTGQQFGPYRVTAEFSYRARYCATDGMVMTGDAFAFLDPVFSSGVFLALKSGEMAADAVDAALTDGDVSAGRFEQYSEDLRAGIEAMRKLVYAFYDDTFSFKDVLMKYPHLRGRLTDCLIGDLFSNFDELFAAVGEFAKVPEPLPHGKPLMTPSCASST